MPMTRAPSRTGKANSYPSQATVLKTFMGRFSCERDGALTRVCDRGVSIEITFPIVNYYGGRIPQALIELTAFVCWR